MQNGSDRDRRVAPYKAGTAGPKRHHPDDDLPVEQPTKVALIISLKAAKQMGLTIPRNVLVRTDKVIR